MARECDSCQLDFTKLERGGRFAGMVTIIFAAMLIALAIGVDAAFQPPFWLQLGFWAPATVFGVIGTLRLYKTALLYRQYELLSEKNAK